MARGFSLLALLLCAILGGSAPAADEPDSARDLFEARCSSCHGTDRSLQKKKDRAGWERTVQRMKRYAAGGISSEDAAAIVDYLVRVRGPED